MKIYRSFFLILFIFAISCHSNSMHEKTDPIIIKQKDIVRTHVGVNGMTCVGCEVTLEHSLSKIIGVVNVKASAHKNEAVIEFDKTKTNKSKIENEISKIGYDVYPLNNN